MIVPMSESSIHPRGAYVVAVDMGYGHQRAAFPLRGIATLPKLWDSTESTIISANTYTNIPKKDRLIWNNIEKTYEGVSRFDSIPFLGKRIFHLMDYLHQIPPFYPRRDLSQPTLELKETYTLIRRAHWGKHLIDTLNAEPLPLICTFPVPAFFAEEHGYRGDIYCLCTDTDVARAWAPLDPTRSRITYLAPTLRAKERLKLYGIRAERIIITGFPLPEISNRSDITAATLSRRLAVLDPHGRYRKKYGELLDLYISDTTGASLKQSTADVTRTPLTIMFSVGGAGAQWEIGITILESLRQHITSGTIRLILAAGALEYIKKKFEAAMQRLGIRSENNIVYAPNTFEYFKKFAAALTETDILWTKPSELSFYAGLGLPIIIAPPLGSQEESNRAWLHMVGAGIEQFDPRFTHEWLLDWLQSGWLAGAAVNGLLNTPKKAVTHIADTVIRGQREEIEDIHFL